MNVINSWNAMPPHDYSIIEASSTNAFRA